MGVIFQTVRNGRIRLFFGGQPLVNDRRRSDRDYTNLHSPEILHVTRP